MTFEQTLKDLKKTYRITVDELADICGVSKAPITNYFKDTQSPSVHILVKLGIEFPDYK